MTTENTVVITVCNRPFYMKEVLDAWQEVRGIENWRFIFMVEPTPNTQAQVSIIQSFRHPQKEIVFNPVLLGVLKNPWEGLNKSFSRGAGFTVLAEEDLVPSTDILEYFEWAKAEARNRTEVLAVCTRPYKSETDSPVREVFEQDRFHVHIWGTWKDRWDVLLRDTWDKNYSTGGPADSGWDWNIDSRLIPQYKKVCLFPAASRTQNMGKFMGVHQQPNDFESTLSPSFVRERPPTTYRLSL